MLKRYILGDLSQEEREPIEERYFANEDAWMELQAVETDLIDSYVRDDLPKRQREQFEKYSLNSPRRRQRLQFARTHIAASPVQNEDTTDRPKISIALGRYFLPLGFAAALVVAAIAVGVLIVRNLRLQEELGKMRAAQATFEQKLDALQLQQVNSLQICSGVAITSQLSVQALATASPRLLIHLPLR